MSRQRTVLLVEDNVRVLSALERMLQGWGAVELLSCDSYTEAVTCIARAPRLDLLLSEVALPGVKTGIDLAHYAVLRSPQLAVVLLTINSHAVTTPLTHRYSFVEKPFGRNDLYREIDSAFEQMRMRSSTVPSMY